MKCKSCKKEIPDDAFVCGYCGIKQAQPTPPPTPKPTAKPPAPTTTSGQIQKGKTNWVVPVVVGLLAVIAITLIWAFVINPGRTPTSPAVESAPKPSQSEPVDDEMSPSVLAGTWAGDIDSSDGKFRITFRMNTNCKIGSICGSFNVPEWGMSGDVVITDAEDGKFYFETKNKSSDVGDGESYEEWLRYISISEIEYYSKGSYGVSNGILKRE